LPGFCAPRCLQHIRLAGLLCTVTFSC